MMIVSFFGGLASQMDQYAFYQALKFHYPDVSIKMDIFNLFPIEHNGFELDTVFNIERNECRWIDVVTLADIFPLKKRYFLPRYLNKVRRIFLGVKESWITPDDPTAFYKDVFELNPLRPYLFFGNWSHENYKKGIEARLRSDFKFKEELTGFNLDFAQKIQKSESVSIHVRRGDYKKCNFPMLDLNYYKAAVDIISHNVNNPFFFIFYYYIVFLIYHFYFLINYVIIQGNCREKSYIDMQLMSLCRHNIIANSGFSYWGAWLNTNPQKIVIAPKNHVKWCKYPIACHDWTLIDNCI